jgi:hypothetical protein
MNVSNGEARADEVRVWLDAATKLDGLFLTQTVSARRTKQKPRPAD